MLTTKTEHFQSRKSNYLILFIFSLLFFNCTALIQPYCPKTDYNQVFNIICQSFIHLKEPHHDTPKDLIDEFFHHPQVHIFVFTKNNIIYGFITMFKQSIFLFPEDQDKKIGLIEHLAVKRTYQNSTIGTELLKFALQKMKAWQCRQVSLYVYKTNNKAKGFFKKLGFKHLAITPHNQDHPLIKLYEDPEDFLFDTYVYNIT